MQIRTQDGKMPDIRGQLAAAEKLFRQASSIEGAEANALLDAEAGLAGVYADSGRRETAIRQYQRTVDVIEKQRSTLPKVDHQLSYFASLIRFYQDYVQFLVSSGLSERAFELAESSRGRLLAHRAGYMRDGGGPSFRSLLTAKMGEKMRLFSPTGWRKTNRISGSWRTAVCSRTSSLLQRRFAPPWKSTTH